jgi:hypothetical protein
MSGALFALQRHCERRRGKACRPCTPVPFRGASKCGKPQAELAGPVGVPSLSQHSCQCLVRSSALSVWPQPKVLWGVAPRAPV